MSPNDQAGRIHKPAFVVSIAVLFALCAISTIARFYIRLRIQRQFSTDDAFLIFAFCCLTSALGILYSVTIDKMYLAEALIMRIEGAQVPPDFLEQTYDFHKFITIALMLVWTAIMAVKFSFLFLFRKLISRIRPLIIYWWVITIFNVGILGYGVSVYYIGCPYYYSVEALNCSSSAGQARTMGHAVAQMVLDLVGDFLILYIPIHLIWKIQIRWTQKAALAISLCLTIFMIMATIIRVSGIRYHGVVDNVWEIYWLILGAEIGIIMAAATAFRTFFVSRKNDHAVQSPEGPPGRYDKIRRLLRQTFTVSSWRSRFLKQSSREYQARQGGSGNPQLPLHNYPDVPRAHMTGLRSFINGLGRTIDASRFMQSHVTRDDDDDKTLVTQDSGKSGHGIKVEQGFFRQSESISERGNTGLEPQVLAQSYPVVHSEKGGHF